MCEFAMLSFVYTGRRLPLGELGAVLPLPDCVAAAPFSGYEGRGTLCAGRPGRFSFSTFARAGAFFGALGFSSTDGVVRAGVALPRDATGAFAVLPWPGAGWTSSRSSTALRCARGGVICRTTGRLNALRGGTAEGAPA